MTGSNGVSYGYEALKGSGEVWAVRRNVEGVITGVVGPLDWTERNPRELQWYEYDNPRWEEDVEWARDMDADGEWFPYHPTP